MRDPIVGAADKHCSVRRRLFEMIAVVVGVVAMSSCSTKTNTTPTPMVNQPAPQQAQPVSAVSSACPADAAWLNSSTLPSEVPGDRSLCNFQQFMWQSMLALVQPTASPTTLQFETWMPSYGVFIKDGLPTPWGQEPPVPCGTAAPSAPGKPPRFYSNIIKQAGADQPLIDPSGQFVYYGMSVNQSAYAMLTSCDLYKSHCAGPLKPHNQGIDLIGKYPSLAFPDSAVELKSSWMVLDEAAAKSGLYYVVPGWIQHATEPCKQVNLGLTGLHIVSKTPRFPAGKLVLSPALVPITDGKATLTITGQDPGNPRGYVDGQVYFTTYTFNPTVSDYNQDPNDLLSAQIYQQHPIDGTPNWQNGIGDMLRKYGMLYPIMGRFQLWTYEGVVINREKILRVLTTDISQPLHMPVSRDLSQIRTNLVVGWLESGMPYGPIGPVGGPGARWDNGQTVDGWGPITSLLVRAGDIIDGIQASYSGRAAPFAGGPGGSPNIVDLTGDAIVAMSGYSGVYFGTEQVAQVTFHTSHGKSFGPYGTMSNVTQAKPFTLSTPKGGAIQSFYGTTISHTSGNVFVAGLGGNVRAV